ncbi:unnamed protein product, partial [Psylliodes chrysocephalus]
LERRIRSLASISNREAKNTTSSSSVIEPSHIQHPVSQIHTSKIIKPPTFDGQKTWVTYRLQFKAAARANDWAEKEKAAALIVSLRGQAATVLQLLPQEEPSYSSIVQALETRYGQQD